MREVFPKALLQWEDFATDNAFRLLAAHRDRIRSFNDDIQGTAAVTLAGLYSACRALEWGASRSAGALLRRRLGRHGIGELIVKAMIEDGLPRGRGAAALLVPRLEGVGGVVTQRPAAAQACRSRTTIAPIATLEAAVRDAQADGLIGVAAQSRAFSEPVVTRHGRGDGASDHLRAVESDLEGGVHLGRGVSLDRGRALFASGSPAAPVTLDGHHFVPRQANNVYIFPGLGLGVVATQATAVSERMFLAAARALAGTVSAHDLAHGSLFPTLESDSHHLGDRSRPRWCGRRRGGAGHGGDPRGHSGWVTDRMYQPVYRPIPTDRRQPALVGS